MEMAISDDDIAKVVKKLVTEAKKGTPWAVKELLDRTLGKARPEAEVDMKPPPVMPSMKQTLSEILVQEVRDSIAREEAQEAAALAWQNRGKPAGQAESPKPVA